MQSFNKMDFRMVLLCIAVSQIGTVVRSQSISPQFSVTTNTINILENATASTSTRLLEFSVSDNGNTGRVISVICYPNSSVPADTCSKFSVLATSNNVGSWHGYIYFQGGSLDYLSVPKYTMVLLAIDDIYQTPKIMTINVLQAWDRPPSFMGTVNAEVSELDTVGVLLIQYQAEMVDPNTQKTIFFKLVTSQYQGYFNLDPVSGRLTNAKALTYTDANWALGYMTINVQAYYGDGGVNRSTSVVSTISLKDINTSPPTFDAPYYYGMVNERSDPRTIVQNTLMTVTDLDHSPVNSAFSLEIDAYNDIFQVSPNYGSHSITANILIVNSSRLNYDTGDRFYGFNVIAREANTTARLSSSAAVNVTIIQVNKYAPVFSVTQYSKSINETAPGGTKVIQVNATDQDISIYGPQSIQYKFSTATSAYFKVDRGSGNITVASCQTPGSGGCIDYENPSLRSFILTVYAVDSYGDGLSATATVTVNIVNDNDNPPLFSYSTYYGSINDGTQMVTFTPSQPVAFDADGNTINNITYNITAGNTNGTWGIDSATGVISPTRNVYYVDTYPTYGYFALIVQASDGLDSHNRNAIANITVNPINRYAPVFNTNTNYTVSIPENALPGFVVATVSATDQDPSVTDGGKVRYRIDSGGQDKFDINSTTGVITVKVGASPFNFIQTPAYPLTITASDLGSPPKTASHFFTIYILQIVPPGPRFNPQTITTPPVPKTSPVGMLVANITASDIDPNPVLVYSFVEPFTAYDPNGGPVRNLTPEDKTMFAVDPNTGVITINSTLNYDRIATWQAVLKAVDTNNNRTGTATVIIPVMNVNQIPPRFSPPWTTEIPFYNVSVVGGKPNLTFSFSYSATSQNTSLFITYQLINDYNGEFVLTLPNSGQVSLNASLSADRDKNVMFVLTATDNGVPPLTSTATVNVQVVGENINSPVFTKTSYNASISETAAPGTSILTILATDIDPGDYGVVRYGLVNQDKAQFVINPITGLITVAQGAQFNAVTEPHISLQVQAYDSPNNADPLIRHTVTAYVDISVIDVNNHAPVFSAVTYHMSILDNVVSGVSVLQVTATDGDLDANAQVAYSITAQKSDPYLFSIDAASGLITTANSLSGFAGIYSLTLFVRDFGVPPLNSTAMLDVTVLLTCQQNCLPQWTNPADQTMTIFLNETDPPGTTVVKLAAKLYPSSRGHLYYYISDQGTQPTSQTNEFDLNTTTGELKTHVSLSYDAQNVYSLIVFIVDDSIVDSKVQRYLIIRILPVENANPSFLYDNASCSTRPYNWPVDVSSPNNSVVGTVIATPLHKDDMLTYSIVTDMSTMQYMFAVVPLTGQILVNGTLQLTPPDFKPQNYTFVVQAVHGTLLPFTTTCLNMTVAKYQTVVTITVSRNPHLPPSFLSFRFNACIEARSDIGVPFFQFNNTNYNQFIPVIYKYTTLLLADGGTSSSLQQLMNIFNVSSNGIVSTNAPLLQYAQKVFQLGITASFKNREMYTDEATTIQLSVYVVRADSEILVTVKHPLEDVLADKNGVLSNVDWYIQQKTNGGIICPVDIKYHTTESGSYDESQTDIFFYAIDGSSNQAVKPLDLDKSFGLDDRKKTSIIGITGAFMYWVGFNYHPVAIAIGLIIGLLVIALIFFICCCCLWALLAGCCKIKEKEPFIYSTGAQGVVNPVWTEKLLEQEQQQLSMNVPDADGLDHNTIALHGQYDQDFDNGDGDVFANQSVASGAMNMNKHHGFAGSAISQQTPPSGYVHIEAPLTMSRSASAFGSGYEASHDETRGFLDTGMGNGDMHGGGASPRMSPHTGAYANQDDIDGAMRGSYSTQDNMNFTRSGMTADGGQIPRSFSTGTMTDVGAQGGGGGNRNRLSSEPLIDQHPVTLNNTQRGSFHAKIGATLIRPNTPGTQGYVQSVISGNPDQYGDTMDYEGRDLPLQKEIDFDDLRPASMYYEDYENVGQQSGGLYQGEIRLNSVSGGRQGSSLSDQIQETRFL